VKRDVVFSMALCAAVLLLAAGFDGVAWPQDAGKKQKEEQKIERISDEDKEVVENMEMLKNLNMFDNADMEMLKNLDVLTANE
jgi:hypothetical protein